MLPTCCCWRGLSTSWCLNESFKIHSNQHHEGIYPSSLASLHPGGVGFGPVIGGRGRSAPRPPGHPCSGWWGLLILLPHCQQQIPLVPFPHCTYPYGMGLSLDMESKCMMRWMSSADAPTALKCEHSAMSQVYHCHVQGKLSGSCG